MFLRAAAEVAAGRPDGSLESFAPHLKRYAEWNEGLLLLVTVADIASSMVRAHVELTEKLPVVLDTRLFRLLDTDADGFVYELLRATAGREYIPERNMSFLRSAVEGAYQAAKGNPRLSD